MSDKKGEDDDALLKAALTDFKGAMRDAESRMTSQRIITTPISDDGDKAAKNEEDDKENKRMHGLAMRIPAEIIAGTVVGYFIGRGLDNFLETGKVFTIIFLLLGNAGAFLNIVRSVGQKE